MSDLPPPGTLAGGLPARDPLTAQWQRHSAFLRRLARGLLSEAEADDALQQAWLSARAQERPPQGELRGWLGRLVRNAASETRRSEARRRWRERAAARDEALPSASDAASRLETTRALVDALAALEEPYRSVVLMRFLDELPPREIARRRGVPVATVRTQVRRGLERLRARLVARKDGDARALLAALLPLAGSPAPPLAAGPAGGGGTLSTGTAMAVVSTPTKLAVAALVVACTSILGWRLLVSAPHSPARSRSADSARAPMAPARPDAAGEELATALVQAPPEAGTRRAVAASVEGDAGSWTVLGRVLRGDLEPYPNVPVVVRLWRGFEQEGAPDEEWRLTTDGNGRFVWRREPPATTMTVLAQVDLEQHLGHPDGELVVHGELPRELELRAYPLDVVVRGRVCDEHGVALSGASVRAAGDAPETDAVKTDGEGRFALRASSFSRRVYLDAWAEGHAHDRVILSDLEAGGERDLVLSLRRALRVRGTVRDRDGRPVADAGVSSFSTAGTGGTRTDAAGRYLLDHLDPKRPRHHVNVAKEGYVLTSEEVASEPDGEVERDIVLDRGVRVEGRVLDEAGRPVPGAALYLGFSPFAWNRLDAVADEGGGFAFPSVQRGAETLVTQRRGFAPDQRTLTLPADSDQLLGVVVTLGAGHWVAGRVVDADGRPMPDVHVSVQYRGEALDGRATTDGAGRFRLEDLPADELELHLDGDGIVRLEVPLERVDVDGLELEVEPAGGLAGRVVDAATGLPLEDFRIRFVDPELEAGERRLSRVAATWTREGHRFAQTGGQWDTGRSELEPGSVIAVEASAEGYAPAVARHVVVTIDPDPDTLVLALSPGARIEGRVVERASGSGLEGVLVKLYAQGEPLSIEYDGDPHGRRVARTDATGRFTLEGVPAGAHHLLAVSDTLPPALDGLFEVPESGVVTRRVELEAGTVLSGRLFDEVGRVLGGEDVQLSTLEVRGGPPRTLSTVTDGAGRFEFGRLSCGLYRLGHRRSAQGVSVTVLTRVVSVVADGVADVELRPEGTATLTGTLHGPEGLPDIVALELLPVGEASTRPSYGALAREGHFEIRGVDPGEYVLQALHVDPRSGEVWVLAEPQPVRLDDGESRELALTLQRSGR